MSVFKPWTIRVRGMFAVGLAFACASLCSPAAALTGAPAPGSPATQAQIASPQSAAPSPPGASATANPALALAATFGEGSTIRSGLHWRVFAAKSDTTGARTLVKESTDATPILALPQGHYLIHVAYGLAGATRAVSVPSQGAASARIALQAGALRVSGMLGGERIPPNRLSIDVYVPQPGNSEAKLVIKDARPDAAIGLPEGKYHIVSTYLDTVGSFSSSARGAPTNSTVSADMRVQTGKLTDVTLRHHAAVLTLKLVNAPGGEALANTTFTVLTPGGDVIRELIGAFPSLVLAEGDYVVIARRDGKTYQSSFSVQSAVDRDIEVMAK